MRLLDLAAIVVNRNLVVGKGLQAEIEGGQIDYGCAQGEPFPIDGNTILPQKDRRQNELSNDVEALRAHESGSGFCDAPKAHSFSKRDPALLSAVRLIFPSGAGTHAAGPSRLGDG